MATAGAYLDQTSTSFVDYLRLYNQSWLRLQQTTPLLNTYEERALYTTWQLSFDRVEQRNELSAKLLILWAYFDSRDIWFELLQHGRSSDVAWMSRLVEDEFSFNEAMRVLCDYGLAEADGSPEEIVESKGYNIHSCVHSWTTNVLNQRQDREMAKCALSCVGSHIPVITANKWWVTQRRLLQHASRCLELVIKDRVEECDIEWALHCIGNLYSDQDKLVKAELMYDRALRGYEKALGPEHQSTLNTVNSLGTLYSSQGKLVEAEKMYDRALRGHEKVLGPEHTSTLNIVNSVGNLYKHQNKLVEAEQMYERALRGYEKTLGPEYISALGTVHNLGVLYKAQGKLVEAEQMYKRALRGYEKTLDPEHTLTLHAIHSLGMLYSSQGKLVKAEKMYERALRGFEKALGPEHTLTLNPVNNLGLLYTRRCFSTINISAQGILKHDNASRNTVLAAIDQLAGLYIRFSRSKAVLLGCIGRLFAWVGDDKRSIEAFMYELSLSSPRYSAYCNGCHTTLSIDTGRLVCKICEDVDLCKSCFDKLPKNELGDILSSCQEHSFLEINGVRTTRSYLTCDADTGVSIERWVKDLANSLK